MPSRRPSAAGRRRLSAELDDVPWRWDDAFIAHAAPSSLRATGRSPATAGSGALTAPTHTSNSTPPHHLPKTPSIPRNPKDTAAYVESPKRRMKMNLDQRSHSHDFSHAFGASFGSAGFAGGGGGSVHAPRTSGGHSVGGRSARSAASARSVPAAAYRNAGGAPRAETPGASPLLQEMSPRRTGRGPGGTMHIRVHSNQSLPNGTNSNAHPAAAPAPAQHALDDDEQRMFEQRLTHDALGVAIRKISHSGKAQLRYVRCVPLRPPSSSDFGEELHPNALSLSGGLGGKGGGDGLGAGNPYLDSPSVSRHGRAPADAVSISSKSSTGSRFLERIHRTSSGLSRRLLPPSNEERGDTLLAADGLTPAPLDGDRSLRALTWGKKNAVTLSLDRFVAVRKGKTTERTLRNGAPAGRVLSLVTNVRENESLDIEAPTRLDRDKFASAFARFLGVPLVEEAEGGAVGIGGNAPSARKKIRTPSLTRSKKKAPAADNPSEPGLPSPSPQSTPKVRNRTSTVDSLLPPPTPGSDAAAAAEDREMTFDSGLEHDGAAGDKETIDSAPRKHGAEPLGRSAASRAGSRTDASAALSAAARKRIARDGGRGESMLEPRTDAPAGGAAAGNPSDLPAGEAVDAGRAPASPDDDDDDQRSHVSSLTGGVDQEIVEELHQAIIELRSELDASRAEAARAVKVAEQAIQSAEHCTSSDWNSTVTHKAAEAAARAQKKSAEAIARARMAEERLAGERRSTGFWRRQAQAAEEEAGSLKTRAAAAETKRAVVAEELASERRRAARMFASLKSEFRAAERRQGDERDRVQERKRELEVALEECQRELKQTGEERKRAEEEAKEKARGPHRRRPHFRRPRGSGKSRPPRDPQSESASPAAAPEESTPEAALTERAAALQTQLAALRRQLELVRHTSADELRALRRQSEDWTGQASRAAAASAAEADHLRERLAAEGAMRLKLLNELQDIRGTVRVYCRPRPVDGGTTKTATIQIPAHDMLVVTAETKQMSFKYDRVFAPGASQREVFAELEEPLVSALDGFNVTLLAFGQGGSGKTHTLLGDVCGDGGETDSLPEVKSHGVQLQAIQQLFTIAGHRTDRYKDSFSMTVVEVHDEKLIDLAADTPSAARDGEAVVCETRESRRDARDAGAAAAGWPRGKLELRTNVDGNTVVQGAVAVPVGSFGDALALWREAIGRRAERLRGQGADLKRHERRANVIATVQIASVNIATGVGTEGKLQFVDMAASDVVPGGKRKPAQDDASATSAKSDRAIEEDDAHFANKCIEAFNDVVGARCQFDRSVPYRNSTLTHLLRDSLEADTKVLLLCCVSADEEDVDDTVAALRFASRMQKVCIGKATKHIIGSKE
ncbi:hypothetical protein ACHAXT_000004 [Thalassiosira profunda]